MNPDLPTRFLEPSERADDARSLADHNLVRHLDADADKLEEIASDAERARARGAMPRLQHLFNKGSGTIRKANLRCVHAGVEGSEIPDGALAALIRLNVAWVRILVAAESHAKRIAAVQARVTELGQILAGKAPRPGSPAEREARRLKQVAAIAALLLALGGATYYLLTSLGLLP